VVENEGVSPNIEVVDRPELVSKEQDPSLEKDVEWLLEEMKKNPAAKVKQPSPVNETGKVVSR
jgi:tricorn protease